MESEVKIMVGVNYNYSSDSPDIDEMFVEQVYFPMPVESVDDPEQMITVGTKEELEAWAKEKFEEYGIYAVKVDPAQSA